MQLLDKDQQAVASLYSWPLHGAYRVRAWQPGETMPLSLILPVPDDLRPGAYRLIVGAFDLLQHQRIPLRTGEDTAALETLRIVLPLDSRAPQTPAAATFGDAIELTGYTLTPTADGLALALFWKALAEPPTDFTSFVHIVDAPRSGSRARWSSTTDRSQSRQASTESTWAGIARTRSNGCR